MSHLAASFGATKTILTHLFLLQKKFVESKGFLLINIQWTGNISAHMLALPKPRQPILI